METACGHDCVPAAAVPVPSPGLILRRLSGLQDYQVTWDAMRAFTAARDCATPDEIWLLEHPPVFTLGQAGRPEHLLNPGEIPVIRTDRGGQVTYHGPGQLIAYVLFDLRRGGIGVKRLVQILEQAVIDLLAARGIGAVARADAPGVYVDGAKIASLGLRVRQGCSYHGLALNVDLDLEPFGRINPCGYPGLAVTRVIDLSRHADLAALAAELGCGLHRALARPSVPRGPESRTAAQSSEVGSPARNPGTG